MNDSRSTKPHRSFGLTDFLWRWIAALTLVLLTYNPSGHSWAHWAWSAFEGEGLRALHYFTGALLLAGWAIFLIATERSLGILGSILGVAVIGTGIWLLVDLGVLRPESGSAIAWLALVALATLLAFGLSWSHIWRRLSGQLEVDED